MILTAGQVAEMLGITTNTVRALAKAGRLTNLAAQISDGRRHQGRYRDHEVRALKAVYAPRRHRRQAQPPITSPGNPLPTSSISSVAARLARIEQKVDQLCRLWH